MGSKLRSAPLDQAGFRTEVGFTMNVIAIKFSG
jgi:hypothetical protein